jgi:hypothetical protein
MTLGKLQRASQNWTYIIYEGRPRARYAAAMLLPGTCVGAFRGACMHLERIDLLAN